MPGLVRRGRGSPPRQASRNPEAFPITRIGPFSPGPDDVVRVHRLLDADASGPHAASAASRRERDRALGRRLGADPAAPAPLTLIGAWCAEHAGADPGDDGAMRAVSATSLLAGALTGAIAAAGAFFYDGSERVNVLLLLGLFVVLPAGTLLLFVAAALSRRGLRAASPGRLGELAGRVMPWRGARDLAALAAGQRGPEVAKWLLLAWAQWFSLGFGVGAVAVAMLLVVFTDLAFGWSTTLDLAPESLHRLASAMALPWRDLLPAAVPSRDLVEASRYFRLSAGTGVDDPQRLGNWWPFVILCMLVYGAAPRLLTTLVARWRLAHACRRALLADPRVQQLLARMTTPLVETRADEPEVGPGAAPAAADFGILPAVTGWQVVNWASVPVSHDALQRLLQPAAVRAVHDAGGTRSSAADRELADRLGRTPDDDGVLVIARGFDPPTLDLIDFLEALRERVPARAPVAVLPMALVDGAPAPLAPRHAAAWAGALSGDAARGILAIGIDPAPVR